MYRASALCFILVSALPGFCLAQQYYQPQQQQRQQYPQQQQQQQYPQNQYGASQYSSPQYSNSQYSNPQYSNSAYSNSPYTTTTTSRMYSPTTTTTTSQYSQSGVTAANCDTQSQQRLNSCASDLMRLGVFSQASVQIESLTLNDLAKRQRDYFVQICNAYNTFNQCVGSPLTKQACYPQEPFKARFAVADAALDYVCGDGHSSMLVNWDCYLTAASRPDVAECESRIAQNTLNPQQSLGDFSQGSSACSALQTYVDCIRAPIEASCGKESFDTVVQAIERPVHVYLPYCTLAAGSILPSLLLLALSLFVATQLS